MRQKAAIDAASHPVVLSSGDRPRADSFDQDSSPFEAVMRRSLLFVFALFVVLAGCGNDDPAMKIGGPDPIITPADAINRFVGAYEQKKSAEYQGMFTGDFTYEFSMSTDPTLVQQYSSGWFKTDEKESSAHLFNGYTPPGGATLPAATTIDINLAVSIPTDDNTSGTDPVTHKVLATRVDGSITVPQAGSEPITYVITNNYNVFYLVRGDVAVNLDTTQPADDHHWYIYRWVDLSEAAPKANGPATQPKTWGSLKAAYH
jgi:hypothetical protein